MQLSIQELEDGITRVVLDGRLDIEGASQVDLKLNVLAGTCQKLFLDFRGVTFLGSMGLRSIVVPAHAICRRGGKVVIFAPIPIIEEVFNTSNISSVLPIRHDLAAAMAVLE